MYHAYKITFADDEGKRKSVKAENNGIIPAIEEGVKTIWKQTHKIWNIVQAEDVTKEI